MGFCGEGDEMSELWDEKEREEPRMDPAQTT